MPVKNRGKALDSQVLVCEVIKSHVQCICSVYVLGAGRNDHTTMRAPLPVCSAKLSIVSLVGTTVGDHVGIPGVVILPPLATTFDVSKPT